MALATLGLLGSWIFHLRRWRGGGGWRVLLRQDGSLRVMSATGQAFEATASRRHSRVFSWAVWLAWRAGQDGQQGVLMIPKDALAGEDWRALRIWLGFFAAPGESGDPAGAE